MTTSRELFKRNPNSGEDQVEPEGEGQDPRVRRKTKKLSKENEASNLFEDETSSNPENTC